MGKIRVRLGDNEIEVDGNEEFIQVQLDAFYRRVSAQPRQERVTIVDKLLETSPSPPKVSSGKSPTPAEYYKRHAKDDGVSQILVFGKYLEEYAGKSQFTPREVNALAKEAKLSKDIHGQYFSNAVKQGLLRKQGKVYSLTLSAEELLAQM
jgi:hypothetical protein